MPTKTVSKILDGLKGKPEAVLAFGAMLVGGGLVASGASELLAFGLPATIYTLYIIRTADRDRIELRKRQMDLEMLDAGKGSELQTKARKAIQKPAGGSGG
jgi:hypothetical protein